MEAPLVGHRAGPGNVLGEMSRGDVLGSQSHALALQIAAAVALAFP